MKVLAIDIGGTFIKYAVVNNGIIEETWKKETGDFVDDTAFYDYLCRNLDDVECGCIGISCPGIIGNDGTILSKAAKNLHILYHSNIVVEVRNRTKKMTYVLNDAHAAGYCEYSLGSGKGEACAVYFIIGTGIGGCVCRENGIDVGASGMLGEFSFLPWKNETKEYGYYAHEAGIPNLVRYYNSYRKATDCTLGEEVFAAYQKKDSNAEKAFAKWSQDIAAGLLMITLMLAPDSISIGGAVSGQEEIIRLIKESYEEMKRRFLPDQHLATKIKTCQYKGQANLIGAAEYAKQKFMEEQL